MQSAILNQSGVSRSSQSARPNLIAKFNSIEVTLNEMEEDLRKLSTDTQVTPSILFSNPSDSQST